MHGGLREDARGAGHLVIDGGERVVLGAAPGETRECPFCGASVAAEHKFCASCGSKVVIETMYMRSLTITGGGGLTIHAGGSLRIGRPPAAPLLVGAASRGDVAAIKARLDAGDEIDGADDDGVTALHRALAARQEDAARYLLAMGASVSDSDARGDEPLHIAAAAGVAPLVEVLLAEGADAGARNGSGLRPADVARSAGHDALARRLALL